MFYNQFWLLVILSDTDVTHLLEIFFTNILFQVAANDPLWAVDDSWRAVDYPRRAADDPWRAADDPWRAMDEPPAGYE